MKHFMIPLIGSGVDLDEIRPNLAPGSPWVGEPHTDSTYLVAVPDDSPITPGQGRIPIPAQSLAAEAARRGLLIANVNRWRAGPPPVVPGQAQAQSGRGRTP